jgi:hypothetical protein
MNKNDVCKWPKRKATKMKVKSANLKDKKENTSLSSIPGKGSPSASQQG